MLNPNAKPFEYQKMSRQHIMSPTVYYSYYQEQSLPLPPTPPPQLLNTFYPNPPSLLATPQLCNPFYSPLPFSGPPPPPHHQQPFPVSGKTQEYYRLMQKINAHRKKGRRIMTKPKNTNRQQIRNRKTAKTISNTSVMMRNIPPSISREKLMEILDQHCIEENKKAMSNHHQDAILSEYDFLYLPIDFVMRRGNLGYAFVNFITCIAAMRFYKSFDKLSWKESMFIDSPKICEICPARIQGKDAHVGHFKRFYFKCDTDEFLPISFSPPRNGSTSRTLPTLHGQRQG
ncbi:protein terminal ear1-like [Papaver somniferum]|nr:protein terminal ear1-like [Papaver somniferum]